MSDKSFIGVIRVPKSASTSLSQMVQQAFDGRRFFELPTLLMRDTGNSPMQRFRARRSQSRHLLRTYKATSVATAIQTIEQQGADGDVIGGGHIDHTTFAQFACPVRYVVLFRDPVARLVSEYNYSRAGYFKKLPWLRFDASVKAKLAAHYSLAGYAQALAERSGMFANTAAQFMGIHAVEEIAPRFQDDVFQAGVIEELDTFREGLAAKTGNDVPAIHDYRTDKITETDVGPRTRSMLEELFAVDYEIYYYAQKTAREQART